MESGEIDLIGLGKIVESLNAGIEEDAVEIWVAGSNFVDECAQILTVGDVVCKAAGFVAVLADEFVDSVLSTANGNNFTALADELLGHT